MSYIDDPVFLTIQQIRTPKAVEAVLSHVWSSWFGKSPRSVQVKPGLTNYKPFERARVMAEATIVPDGGDESAVTLNLLFHIFVKAETAYQEAKSCSTQDLLGCEGLPVFLVPHWQAVIWTLPNAPNLKELGQLLNPEKFCQLLMPPELQPSVEHYPTPKLFRYVPLKRALLTWEHPTTHRRYFAKLFNDADAARVVRNFQQINQAFERGELGFDVPQLISYNPSIRTLLMTEVSGTQFTEVMRRVFPKPFARVGRVLAQLHRLNICPETVWTPDKELDTLRRHMKGVKLALPQLKHKLDGAIAQLEACSLQFSFPQNQPIHGNLFGDQILYTPNRIGMVDWDALSLGDPLYDIGRLISHLIYIAGCEGISPSAVSACAEALLEAYEAETHPSQDLQRTRVLSTAKTPRTPRIRRECVSPFIERSRLAWHIATQLLLRGKISSLRKLPEEWQAHLAFAINESEQLLNGESHYLPLPALQPVVLSEVL